MGSFRATFSVNDGREHRVLFASTELSRGEGPLGKPTTVVSGGKLRVRIEAEAGTDVIEAMVNNQHAPVSAKLTYYKTEDDSVMRETIGELGFITKYVETIDTTGQEQATLLFDMRFQVLQIGGAVLENPWTLNG